MDEFDELLLKTIDETLRYTFGDVTTGRYIDILDGSLVLDMKFQGNPMFSPPS